MSYGIIRVREIGRGQIASTQEHNSREYEKNGKDIPDNIDKERIKYNKEVTRGGNDLAEAIDKRLQWSGVKERKNSVVGIEIVVSANKDFWQHYEPKAFFDNAELFLAEKYGLFNVVARHEHYDESNPHCHFMVVPIVEKEVKWKNERGEGVKIEERLSARDLTGTKKHLIALQDDFFKHLDKRYNWRLPPEKMFVRGKSSLENNKKYSKQTNHELGVLREDLAKTRKMLDEIRNDALGGLISVEDAQKIAKSVYIEEIKPKEALIEKLETKVAEILESNIKIERRQELNSKDEKWKKDEFKTLEPPKTQQKPKQRGMEM